MNNQCWYPGCNEESNCKCPCTEPGIKICKEHLIDHLCYLPSDFSNEKDFKLDQKIFQSVELCEILQEINYQKEKLRNLRKENKSMNEIMIHKRNSKEFSKSNINNSESLIPTHNVLILKFKEKPPEIKYEEFDHSWLCYHIAKTVINDFENGGEIEVLKCSYFNRVSFIKHKLISKFLGEMLTQSQKEILFQIVLGSRDSADITLASSNAITILNRANYSFNSKDLHGINTPEADLSCGVFYKTNFNNANLSHADFSQSQLLFTNFNNSNILNANFGKISQFSNKNHYSHTVAGSPNGKLIASGCRDNTIKIYSLEKQEKVSELKIHTDTVDLVMIKQSK